MTSIDKHDLKLSIIDHLGRAMEMTAQRLERMAAGESVFSSDADLKATLALLKVLPDLLPLLRTYYRH